VQRSALLTGGVLMLIAAISGGIVLMRRDLARKPQPALPRPAQPPVFEGAESTFSGRVQPRTTITVGATVDGVLESYFVDVDQEVYEGQLLGRIRNTQLDSVERQAQAAIDAAQARAADLEGQGMAARLEASRASADQSRARSEMMRLEKSYQRQQMLWKEGATPRLDFEKAEREYNAAKTEFDTLDAVAKRAEERGTALQRELDTARRSLAENTQALESAKAAAASGDLHSPADGVVVSRRGQPGEPVDRSMKDLVEIATDLKSMQVAVSPEPPVLARIRAGQSATVRLPDLSPDEFPGKVRELRGAEAIVDFTSPTPVLKLGAAAQVRIKF